MPKIAPVFHKGKAVFINVNTRQQGGTVGEIFLNSDQGGEGCGMDKGVCHYEGECKNLYSISYLRLDSIDLILIVYNIGPYRPNCKVVTHIAEACIITRSSNWLSRSNDSTNI